MEFVALLSTGKGNWVQIAGLISQGDWDKIILLGDEYAKKFSSAGKAEFIAVNLKQNTEELQKEFIAKLKGKLHGAEVALSIASGSGKEHMALISALLHLPVGIRFVVLTKDGIKEF